MRIAPETRLPLLIITNAIHNAESYARFELKLPKRAIQLVTDSPGLRGLGDRVFRTVFVPSTRQNGRSTTAIMLDYLRYLEACRALRMATDEDIDIIRRYFTEGLGAMPRGKTNDENSDRRYRGRPMGSTSPNVCGICGAHGGNHLPSCRHYGGPATTAPVERDPR